MPVNFDIIPTKLLRKGHELSWDPAGIDVAQDKKDWETLNQSEKDFLLQMVLGFKMGEKCVAHDLSPLQHALRYEKGRMEEEMYLTQQSYEESLHVVFFEDWIDKMFDGQLGKSIPYPVPEDRSGNFQLLGIELPRAMQALANDRSVENQLKASVTYHIHVEGILAEFGYQLFYQGVERLGLFPGLLEGIHNIQRDEVRHIAFGMYFIQRLLRDNPELEEIFDAEMERLKPISKSNTLDGMIARGEDIPFGLDHTSFTKLFNELYESRIGVIKRGDLIAV